MRRFIPIVLICFNMVICCMDEPHAWNKFRQQHITLHLSDGNDFKIATWKIIQSIALQKDYIRREKKSKPVKNMSLLYSTVNQEEMQLYSTICDREPGKAFNDYFARLKPHEQEIIIGLSGKYGKNNEERKLHCPKLVAQLLEPYFLKTGYSNDNLQIFLSNHIKPLIKSDKLLNICAIQMVKNNIPFFMENFDSHQNFEITYADDGKIQKIPSCLVGNPCIVKNNADKKFYGDKEFILYGVKKFKDGSEYHLTSSVPFDDQAKKDNQILIRLMNSVGLMKSSIMIEHEGEFRDFAFDTAGNYLSLVSAKMTEIVQLEHNEDSISVLNNLKITMSDDAAMIASCFNKQSNAYVYSLHDFSNDCGELVLIQLSDQYQKSYLDKQCGMASSFLFSNNGDRLLTDSYKDDSNTITLWDTSCVSNPHRIKDFDVAHYGIVKTTACGPHGKKYAIVFHTGNVMFIHEKKNNKFVTTDCRLPYCRKELANRIIGGAFQAQYSNDNCFVAIFYSIDESYRRITLYSTVTYEPLRTMTIKFCGMGFTANDSELVLIGGDPAHPTLAKMQLFTPDNHRDLDYLRSKTSLLQCASILDLRKACKSNKEITLYEEEQMYKSLLLLQHDLFYFLNRYFSVIGIINNNKPLKETFEDIINVAQAEYDSINERIWQWWNNMNF